VPSKGFEQRGKLVVAKASTKLTARDASPLVSSHQPGRLAFYCSLGL
jgi:hypothetical protein